MAPHTSTLLPRATPPTMRISPKRNRLAINTPPLTPTPTHRGAREGHATRHTLSRAGSDAAVPGYDVAQHDTYPARTIVVEPTTPKSSVSLMPVLTETEVLGSRMYTSNIDIKVPECVAKLLDIASSHGILIPTATLNEAVLQIIVASVSGWSVKVTRLTLAGRAQAQGTQETLSPQPHSPSRRRPKPAHRL